MTKINRNIPEPVKREVRQRCGFGCVICGMPIFEYDHIDEFSEVRVHQEENITLLCPQHHAEKTRGLLTKEMVRKANSNPFCKQHGQTSPFQLRYSEDTAVVKFGNLVFTQRNMGNNFAFTPLLIDGVDVVRFRIIDNKYFLNLLLVNEFNIPIIQIIDNELVVREESYDVRMISNRLKISYKERILLELIFNAPNEVVFSSGMIYFNGVRIEIKDEVLYVHGKNCGIGGSGTMIGQYGLMIGFSQPRSGLLSMRDVNRYEHWTKDNVKSKNKDV